MKAETCETCKYFIQHYSKNKWGVHEVNCGHCTHPRIKSRVKQFHACEKYKEREESPSPQAEA